MLHGEPIQAQNAILRLQRDVDARLQEVGHEGRDADTQVHIHAIFDLFGCAAHHTLPADLGITIAWDNDRLAWGVYHAEFNRLLVVRASDDTINIDRGQVNAIGVELTIWNDLFHLDDASASSCGDRRVEVTGRLSELHVAGLVSAPGLHESEVAGDRLLENVLLTTVSASLARHRRNHSSQTIATKADGEAALLDKSANASRREESRDASASSSALLCKSALGHKFDLELAAQVLALELFVLAHIG
mmetsp:Transcript_45084/g.59776  ORF Transcript_45084/g.59776 Transcript_45084/m.59776 type:complete len:247 (+) Transcript_45084:655-1395(+)